MPKETFRYYEAKDLQEATYTKEDQYASGWVVTKVEDKNKREIEDSPLLGREFGDKERVSGLTEEDGVTITLTAVFSDSVVIFDFSIVGAVASNGTRYTPEYINVPEKRVAKNGQITFTDDGVEFTGFHMVGYKDSSNNEYQLNTPYRVNQFTANSEGIVTMTSIWAENTYEVYYVATGSQVRGEDMGHDTFNYYERKELRENTYTKPGYSFVNWQAEKVLNSAGVEVDINSLRGFEFADKEEISRLINLDGAKVYLETVFENNHKHKLCGAGQSETCPHRGPHLISTVFEPEPIRFSLIC